MLLSLFTGFRRKNGTFVNEKRVPAAKYYELREGGFDQVLAPLVEIVCAVERWVILLVLKMPHYPDEVEYSDKYADDKYEYRHVILPKRIAKDMFRIFQAEAQMRGRPTAEPRLLTESEWRGLGVQQSRGWMHYENHRPEPHILLFRRPLGTNPLTGQVDRVPGEMQPPPQANIVR
ncbi:Cyclin-dependent kinases regulatory subunit 2 [Perkinsus olseni]|uniref:Cyclin-dependent kinases regulatory subunit n=1 Tax=Perkinsus olseni TaxID=32597 RepID=A0A7J6NQA7_PEROL|nr:Cyclin-dependent kinases regulatory subunit 2 [Perkinsus olseni]